LFLKIFAERLKMISLTEDSLYLNDHNNILILLNNFLTAQTSAAILNDDCKPGGKYERDIEKCMESVASFTQGYIDAYNLPTLTNDNRNHRQTTMNTKRYSLNKYIKQLVELLNKHHRDCGDDGNGGLNDSFRDLWENMIAPRMAGLEGAINDATNKIMTFIDNNLFELNAVLAYANPTTVVMSILTALAAGAQFLTPSF
jgi:hypothetical protein